MKTNRALPIAASRAATLRCPRLYGASYIERSVPSEPWARHLAFGSGVHSVLKELYDPTTGYSPAERVVEPLARTALRALGYPNDEMVGEDVTRVTAIVRAYVAADRHLLNTVRTESDERFDASAAIGETLHFSARLDRVVVAPNRPEAAIVIDYKTGRPGEVDMDSACVTMAVARAVLRPQYRDVSVIYQYINETGIAAESTITAQDVRHIWPDLLARGQRVYNGGDRTPVPGPLCQFCRLRQDCRPVLNMSVAALDTLFDD